MFALVAFEKQGTYDLAVDDIVRILFELIPSNL
jgi:hypothetical protein